MLKKEEQLNRLVTLVTSLQSRDFFGDAQVKLQRGNIVQVLVSQSIKLDSPTEVLNDDEKES